jgi:hypothetical protein
VLLTESAITSVEHVVNQYSNNVLFLQKSIESMEANGIAVKGKIRITEVVNKDNSKSVRVVIGSDTKDFPSTIEACDYIVKCQIEESKRKLVSRIVLEGAVIGAAVALVSNTSVVSGVSIGTLTALFTAKIMGR